MCKFCGDLAAKTVTTPEWKAHHQSHGASFTKESFPHPSGRWFWLVCACGAKHLFIEPERTIEEFDAAVHSAMHP